MTLPPLPPALPDVSMACVDSVCAAALLVTVMLPAVPPAPAPTAAPVLAVKAPSAIAPVVLLNTVMVPAAPPEPSVAEPAPPLAVIAAFPAMPPIVVMLTTPPAPPA